MAAHRILVTGLGGFVGQVLAGVARARADAGGIALLALADRAGAAIDIRDAAAVQDAVARLAPTAVVHLAAIASPRDAMARPDEAWAVNVTGTFDLARAVLKHAPEARFVFSGSSEAYGASFARHDAPVREDAMLDPLSPYGATKAAADIMLGQMARQGLKAIRFRPFNHTGPGQAPSYVIASFARQIVRIENGWQAPVMRVGNLGLRRDMLDARDVARAYLDAAIGAPAQALGEAFNLSTGRPVAIRALLDGLLGASGAAVAVEVDPALLRAGEIGSVAGAPDKAGALLGWRPAVDLADTLRDVLGFWRLQAAQRPDGMRD